MKKSIILSCLFISMTMPCNGMYNAYTLKLRYHEAKRTVYLTTAAAACSFGTWIGCRINKVLANYSREQNISTALPADINKSPIMSQIPSTLKEAPHWTTSLKSIATKCHTSPLLKSLTANRFCRYSAAIGVGFIAGLALYKLATFTHYFGLQDALCKVTGIKNAKHQLKIQTNQQNNARIENLTSQNQDLSYTLRHQNAQLDTLRQENMRLTTLTKELNQKNDIVGDSFSDFANSLVRERSNKANRHDELLPHIEHVLTAVGKIKQELLPPSKQMLEQLKPFIYQAVATDDEPLTGLLKKYDVGLHHASAATIRLLNESSQGVYPLVAKQECPICCEIYQKKNPEQAPVARICGHIVCRTCYKQLIKNPCPICRDNNSSNQSQKQYTITRNGQTIALTDTQSKYLEKYNITRLHNPNDISSWEIPPDIL